MSNSSFTYVPAPYPVEARPRGVRFSGREIFQLLVSTLVLTVAFSISRMNGIFGTFVSLDDLLFVLPIAFVAVLTGYLLHELAHKLVAQGYGMRAEFRYWPFGLLFALLTSLMGFVFAAPGAVMIHGRTTLEKYGRISAAGPMVNLLIGAILTPMIIMLPSPYAYVAFFVATINVFLAGFNLLPIPPLDGSKIFGWNKAVWAAMIASAAGLYILQIMITA
ncbi:MAG: hypothetical protein HZB92_06265 [Euryarchaeota archaeon]|nr:hypothetical protein [Euryarchaeota archaeon]